MGKIDGSVRINTELDTDDVKKGAEEIKDELEDVGEELEDIGKNSDKASDSIGGNLADGFKKLGKAIAAAKIAEKLYEFSKESIELGSDLEEVQNVVDVTFTTMSDKVNQFAKDAKKSAGLSETMAKEFAGTFGTMADSIGFAEAEAFEMAITMTQMTGDLASFRNLSQDDAFEKLKGVFTGETEALKSLGVVMTQTALDAYAMANGFGKTTDQMTEQEKVALRYQFVMDQLSAASGDFVRTQEGWANQSRVLSLQWESLMATVGTGLIDVLSPGIEFLNNKALPKLNDFADEFAKAMDPTPSEKLRKSLNSFEDAIESSNKEFAETSQTVEANARLADRYKDRLDKLEKAGLDTAASQKEYAAIVEYLNEIYPELNLKINEQTGLLDANSAAQLQNLDVMKQRALLAAQEAQHTAQLDAWAQATVAVTNAEVSLIQVQEQKGSLIDEITFKTGKNIDELYRLYTAQKQQESAMQSGNEAFAASTAIANLLTGSVSSLTKEEMDLLEQIMSLDGEEKALNKTIKEGQKTVDSYDKELERLGDTLDETGDKADAFAEGQEEVTSTQEKATTAIAAANESLKEMQAEYDEAKEAALSSIEAQVGAFDKLVIKSDKSADDIIKNWESQREAFDNYKSNLEKAIDMGLDEALVKQLSDGSEESMAILNEFVNSTDTSIDEINEAFRKTQQSKEIVATTMGEIQADMLGKLDTIYQEIESTWGDAEAVVKRTMRQMQEDINGLQGKSVTIEVKTKNGSYGYSGKDMSMSNPSNRSYTPVAANVPYLASGAVIPPNAPFMAVLGDQRHGTNIEAPLSTIQEAVSNVLEGAILSGFAAMIKEQKATQEILRNIEIGDTIIGQAVDRYNEQNNIIRGGLL